ncbi:hypothetical protein [Nonomuraea longispora]|nr:hypothetical protein [Nonomuraea longispora]
MALRVLRNEEMGELLAVTDQLDNSGATALEAGRARAAAGAGSGRCCS